MRRIGWGWYRRARALRRGVRFRGQAFGAEAQRDQGKRIDFAVGHEVLVGLKTFERVGGVRAPFAVRLAVKVALARQRLLDFLVAIRRWAPVGNERAAV